MTSLAAVLPPNDAALAEAAFLRSFEERLREAVPAQSERPLDAAAMHSLGGGAKRARPLLAYRFARVASAPTTKLLDAAVALELVHTASLVHDDIIDTAALRRGVPTVHAKWGTPEAVLAGDVLLCRSLVLLSSMPQELKRTAEVFEEMCRAARREYFLRKRVDLTLDAWTEVAEGKTGALFGLAAYFGGSLAGDIARAERFERAARDLGVAFQIADDVSDLARSAQGAQEFTDLRDGNPSLPVALALRDEPALGPRLVRLWEGENADPAELEHIAAAVLNRQVCEEAEDMLRRRVQRAVSVLGEDAAHPALRRVLSWGTQLAADLEGLLNAHARRTEER